MFHNMAENQWDRGFLYAYQFLFFHNLSYRYKFLLTLKIYIRDVTIPYIELFLLGLSVEKLEMECGLLGPSPY